ncbi:hypothetical protein [Clostridium estertheticum]|uniref:Uncharacterized protein n=1 Tax=Clostridium estertheticum TaxID=238834 RepID=A0A7Y3WV77_9CLOT|nr:hypothetical protein [Clostridium estertheticum]MBW9174045.1 hypothetical protein [Clostridium estertheticum]NNU78765.1 hypothetical protein [Clostridium estertheticum]WBL49442.1 hypothetical protein LOR37_22825 [Clostridium estertheticum]WBL49643.1 hypothetical protein LOR37_23000 [Clostridium estertheticum]WBL49666.1 hypothetical protein LOR37_23390 [Clostridium estertheticum]
MRFNFNLVFMAFLIITILIRYMLYGKQKYNLLAIPLVLYFFVIWPIIEKSGINTNVGLSITIFMVIISFVYAYKGLKILKVK